MNLVHSPAEIIQQYCVSQGMCLLGGIPPSFPIDQNTWPSFCNYSPPEGTNQLVCFYDTAAIPDGRLMRGGVNIYHPGIQILVKHQLETNCYDKAKSFQETMQQITSVQLVTMGDGVDYHLRNAAEIKLPLRVGQEIGKDRIIYTVNFVVLIDEFCA